MEPRFRSLGLTLGKGSLGALLLLLSGMAGGRLHGQDWGGEFTLVPVSAPEMVLEAVDSGTNEGTTVSIGNPSGKANQKWTIVPKGDNLYLIGPSCPCRTGAV